MKAWKRILAVGLSACSLFATACGEVESSATDSASDSSPKACEHEWEEEVVKKATCTKDGKLLKTCEKCGAEEEEKIPANHDLKESENKPATCTTAGWAMVYCVREGCDYTTTKTFAPLGHKTGDDGRCTRCGQNQNQPTPPAGDATKVCISVGTYYGAVGGAWLDAAAKRFEELHANTMFGDKKGVRISVDADKVHYGGEYLSNSTLTKDIYFTEGVDYYSFVYQGKVANLSDIVTAPMTQYGEKGTIEDKLDDTLKTYLTAKDGNYYMLPFYDGFYGFIYDVELFEEESFYFDDAGAFIGVAKDADDATKAAFEAAKSNGPDGKDGTYDDGLPATYAQMLNLVSQINAKGFIPFCYAGETEYVDKAFRGYIADYEKYEGMMVNYTFNGKANVVTSISGDTVSTQEITISTENGYELQKQAGKYYALKMEEALFGSTAYIGRTTNMDSYTAAQSKYISSKNNGTRYAMLAEGVWWENEAELSNAFSSEERASRRFAFMPVPKVDASRAGEQTMISLNRSYAFINENSQNMEVAKEFMRFLHTDAEMSKFTATTSVTRSLSYSILDADRAKATNFGKSLIDMRNSAKVVYPYSSVKLVLDNADAFSEERWFSTTRVGSSKYTSPMNAFMEGKATAKSYFDGLYTYQQGQWGILKK